MTLLRCMKEYGVRNFIFSSSCTVYGAPDPENLPVKETDSVGACYCPYAKSKFFCESLLEDMSAGEPDYWRIVIMRYFNPVGAHESGLLGEHPRGEPRNLMPKLAQVRNLEKAFRFRNPMEGLSLTNPEMGKLRPATSFCAACESLKKRVKNIDDMRSKIGLLSVTWLNFS